MALYAIGDPHLSLSTNKPMDVFGGAWKDYVEKLSKGLADLKADDVLVLDGDISWGMTLEEALKDFQFLNGFSCRKILVKGNHDYWWSTLAKMNTFFQRNNLDFEILHNNAILYKNKALCGTRGWFYEETGNDKIFKRELLRLETSLQAGGDNEKIVFLHYPPLYQGYRCEEILELMKKYEVKHCYYGHLHGPSLRRAIDGNVGGIIYHLISADYLDFKPLKILDF